MNRIIVITLCFCSTLHLLGCALPSDGSGSSTAPNNPPAAETITTSNGGQLLVSKTTQTIQIPNGHTLHGFTADANAFYMLTGSTVTNLNFTKSTSLATTFVSQCSIADSGLSDQTGMAWDGSSIYLIKGTNSFAKFSGTDCSAQSTINLGLTSDVAQAPFAITAGKLFWNHSMTYDGLQSPPTSTVGAILSETDLASGLTDTVMSNTSSSSVVSQFGNYAGPATGVWVSHGVVGMAGNGSVLWVLFSINSDLYLWKISKQGEVTGWAKIPTSILPDNRYFNYFIAAKSSSEIVLANQNPIQGGATNPTVTFTTLDVSGF